MVKFLESWDEFQYLMNNFSNRLIVLDFTATWCGPCQRIAPFFEQLGVQYPQVIFYRVDIDDFPEVASEFNVSGVPDFKFIVNGKLCHQFSGVDSTLLEDVIRQLSQKVARLPPQPVKVSFAQPPINISQPDITQPNINLPPPQNLNLPATSQQMLKNKINMPAQNL